MNYEEKISTGLLHCHTEHSLLDSTLKPEELVKRAAELGAKAVALTDHGTMTAVPSFKKAAKEHGILPIIGVEAYVADNKEDERLHLILMATDLVGERAIGKLMTAANTNVTKVGKLRFPVATKEMLTRFFAEGTEAHGHVIATSACMNGVLIGLSSQNAKNRDNLGKMKKAVKSTQDILNIIEFSQNANAENTRKMGELASFIKKSFKAREKMISKITDPAEKAAEEEKLNKEKADSEKASVIISRLKAENAARQKKMTELKKKLPKDMDMVNAQIERVKRLEESICTEDVIVNRMEAEALWYDGIFGHGNFYIEIQNHGVPEELKYMHILVKIAEKYDIPYVAANDIHMAKKEDAFARQIIRSLRFNKWSEENTGDSELYIKTDKELFASISHAVGAEKADIAMQNIGRLVSRCKYEEDDTKHYPKFSKTENADELIRKLAYEGISKRYTKEEWTKEYADRLEYELSVITKMGYSDYHLIDQDFINFTKKLGYMPEEKFQYLTDHIRDMSYEEIVAYVDADQSNVGYVIGPGRGSAAGSLVCYLLGITNIDPIKNGLIFERFLNPERVSMPDIDTDFANGYRDIAVIYVAKKYGENAVCRIVTEGTSAARGSIRNVARVLATKEGNDEEYINMIGDTLARCVPLKPGATIKDNLDAMQPVFAEYPEAKVIIDGAMAIEGTVIQYGMHAAGVIISDNDDVSDYVPLMIDDKTKNWKCQVNMTEAEEAHLLKMDFLGLRNLNIITDTLRLIRKTKGIKINPDKDIKIEKKVISSICATGKTNSIFQLESGGMKSMLQQFGPDSFEDLTLLLAAYRPGPMDFIPQMIEVKHGRRAMNFATPELEPILSVTYGCIIYQEQVQQIFQKLAGYSLGQADIVRRAMSKKKEKVLMAERESFINGDPKRNIPGCVKNGIPANVASDLFDSMREFSKYAFNKSHAAAYALITYITAWLKYYYPTEYLCVAMEYATSARIQGLIEECKGYNIAVKPLDINKSEAEFSVEGNDIYFGITSIKGIGNIDATIKARKEKKFVSFADYMFRGHFDKTVTNNLIDAGAFDAFCPNRKALTAAAEIMMAYLKDYRKIEKDLQNLYITLDIVKEPVSDTVKMERLQDAKIKTGKTIPIPEKIESRITDKKAKLSEIKEEIEMVVIPVEIPENLEEKLEREKELLGVYITGHPIDAYEMPEGTSSISELVPSKTATVTGIVRDFRIVQRKKDNADMAFFNLEDKTDSMKVVCFANDFANCNSVLHEGAVVSITGKVAENEVENVSYDENGEETSTVEVELQMYCKVCKPAQKKKNDLIMNIPNIMEWTDHIRNEVRTYETMDSNYRLVLHDKLFNEMRVTSIGISLDIKKALPQYFA